MLRLSGVTKRFGARTVLSAVSLELDQGEYAAILGESGIGKSTLLHAIAGLEPVDSGSIQFEGVEITRLDDDAATRLRRARFGFVFQAFHILPHLSVAQNVGLPLMLRGVPQAAIDERAAALVAAVGMAGREASLPRERSGGELQRGAIARALVGDPSLVLGMNRPAISTRKMSSRFCNCCASRSNSAALPAFSLHTRGPPPRTATGAIGWSGPGSRRSIEQLARGKRQGVAAE